MKSTRFKFDKFITFLRWPVAVAGIVYLACMVVAPWIMGSWSWSHVQEVWDRWQSVNVAILAFGASFIAFEISRYKENRQNEREFLAGRAFLPGALSELTAYLKSSARVHIARWDNEALSDSLIPTEAVEYKSVFENCIRHAEPEVAEFLASLLSGLQVHDARLRDVIQGKDSGRASLYSYLLSLGELQFQVNRLFPFARGEEGFDSSPITWDEFNNAYMNLGIHVSDYEMNIGDGRRIDLETSTKRLIARMRGEKEPPYGTSEMSATQS